MRRCGAVVVSVEESISDLAIERIVWPRGYFFCWPASGGVWVLRLWLTDSELWVSDDNHYRTDGEIMEQNMQEAVNWTQRYDDNIALTKKLNRQEDMEDVCRVLEEAGAHFYAVIEDSPEAVEMKLC